MFLLTLKQQCLYLKKQNNGSIGVGVKLFEYQQSADEAPAFRETLIFQGLQKDL